MSERETSILIVDDQRVVRKGLRAVIEQTDGLRVCSEAPSVEAAIEAYDRNGPELVLLDLSLPDGSGFDVLRHVREKSDHTKVLIVSSYPPGERADIARQGGADGYVDKARAGDALIHAIQTVIGGEPYFETPS